MRDTDLDQLVVERDPFIVRPSLRRQDPRDAEDLVARRALEEVDLMGRMRRHAHHELVQMQRFRRLPRVLQIHVEL